MEGTGKMLDYTAHMYSGQEHTSVKGRQANRQGKEYARHPPWLVLPDQASRPWRPPGQRDTEAMQSPGGGGSGGALPETLGQKYRLIYLSVSVRTKNGAKTVGRLPPAGPTFLNRPTPCALRCGCWLGLHCSQESPKSTPGSRGTILSGRRLTPPSSHISFSVFSPCCGFLQGGGVNPLGEPAVDQR